MKKFVRVFSKEKSSFKMTNQTSVGFDLIILDMNDYNNFLKKLETFTSEDQVSVVWQMKHKRDTYTMYINCTFDEATDNMNTTLTPPKVQGKRLHVTCKEVQYYSDSMSKVGRSVPFTKTQYKPKQLLDRMLKIAELNTLDV